MSTEIHEEQEVLEAGVDLENADKAVILIHGRGGSAEGILGLEEQLDLDNTAFFAPQAYHRTWYPQSFMQPREENQPHLNSALSKIRNLLEELSEYIEKDNIFLVGFSQGGCLAAEYAASNPARFGGVLVFSGGLIGEELASYCGDLESTTVFLGCAENDSHIPKERVDQTESVFRELNASVEKHIFEGSLHGITDYELKKAREIIGEK